MHPPFYMVDHRIDHDPHAFEERRVIRRNQPAYLRLTPPAPGTPLSTMTPVHPPGPAVPRNASWLWRFIGQFRQRITPPPQTEL